MKNKTSILMLITIAIFAIAFNYSKVMTMSVDEYDQIKADQILGASVLRVFQGGTGAGTFTAGECIVGNGTGALTSQACGGGGSFATTTNDYWYNNTTGITPSNQITAGSNLTWDGNTLNAGAGSMTTLPHTNIYVGNSSNMATATSSLTILDNGNVGIGTDSPQNTLEVDGDVFIGTSGVRQGLLEVNLTDDYPYVQAIKMVANRSGLPVQYGFNGTSIGANTINVGLYGYASEATNNYGLQVASGYGYFADMVGIKDTTPSYDLDVNGTFRVTGVPTFNTAITDENISDSLTVTGYMQDTDIDTFAELQSWAVGYTDNNTQLSDGDIGAFGYIKTDTNTQLTDEQVQDKVGAMVTGNTETNITVTYQDADGTIDFVVTDSWYNSLADLQGAVTNDFHNLGGTDANTTYLGGTNLTLSGTTFNVDNPVVANLTGTASGNLVSTDINTYSKLNTIVADQTLVYAGGAFHDGFSDFVANEHTDWRLTTQGTIHATNYVDNNTTYTAGGTLLDLTTGTFSLNEGTLTDGKLCTYVSDTGLVCNTTATAGTLSTIKSAGSQVGGADIGILDFNGSFVLGEDPDKEINISLDFATVSDLNTGTDTQSPINSDVLAGSNVGLLPAGIALIESSASVAIKDGTTAIPIIVKYNGMNLVDVQCNVTTKGVTGTTDIQVRRSRAGTDVDMLTTKVTIGDEYFARDEAVNASNDDVQTGDALYFDVDAIHTGTAPKGLSCITIFQLP